MKQKEKIIIVIVMIVIVAGVSVLVGRSEILQGRFAPRIKELPERIDYSDLYFDRGKIVSAVTSPVTSVVESDVTSEGGVSRVPSAVTSPVASAVALQPKDAAKVDAKKLPKLTEDLLEKIAQEDYKKNPARFTLSDKEKQKIIELYKKEKGLK